jgi:NTP pyrophosphatase (non-canonical NTP hydrolase)
MKTPAKKRLVIDLDHAQLMQLAALVEPHVGSNSHPLSGALAAMLRLIAEPNPPEPLRREVGRFALAMERKLRLNDHKGGWTHESIDYLLERLDEEVEELKKALHPMRKDDPQRLLKEAVDVANFCMMIADVVGALKDEP